MRYLIDLNAVILNFLPIGMNQGGGLQNSLSFISTIGMSIEKNNQQLLALTFVESSIQEACLKAKIPTLNIQKGMVARLKFELNSRFNFRREQICFTIFGPVMLSSKNYLININGCAYSNLFYPEISFWAYLEKASRARRELVDCYRRWQTQAADYWIFETEALRQRAVELCHFPLERVGVVRMAPSQLVRPELVDPETRHNFNQRLPDTFKFLFLCGAQPNKRLHLLPDLAKQMCVQGFHEFCFITTLPPDAGYTKQVMQKFRDQGVYKHIHNIGSIPSNQIVSLIDCIQAMCTFSLLESFSNNFVEAWRMNRPLIVTDADWSRSSCGQGALYVDPTNSLSAAEKMTELANKSDVASAFVEAGSQQLASYPTPEEKMNMYFEEINKARLLGPCSNTERKLISWPVY